MFCTQRFTVHTIVQPEIAAPRSLDHPRHRMQQLMSLDPGQPERLRIAKLGIDEPITGVGMNTAGEMIAPSDPNGVAWYKLGYMPGALGNAVLAAHYWHVDGRGVFYQLGQLAAGDAVEVDTANGELFFKVVSSQSYPAAADISEIVFGASTKAQLNLVTCTGPWIAARKQYADRLVVTSVFDHELLAAK